MGYEHNRRAADGDEVQRAPADGPDTFHPESKMTVRAIIQARMLSTRLRGKSLISVAGKPLLGRVLDRLGAMSFLDSITVATTPDAADEPIAAMVESRGLTCVRGDRDDLLGRFIQASADLNDDDCIVRFTADNPLYDPARSAKVFEAHVEAGADYTHIDGLSHMVPEFVQVGALRKAGEVAKDVRDREHVTPYFRRHKDTFRVQTLPSDAFGLRADLDPDLTVDRQEQLERLERMFKETQGADSQPDLDACYAWMDADRARLYGITPRQPGQLRARLAGHEVGDGCMCFVIAEIGQNHNGQVNLAKRLIDMAVQDGCQAVKFQKRDIGWELTKEAYDRAYDNPNSFGETYGKHREFLELDEKQHLELRDYASSQGIVYMCTPCDPPSVEIMERIGNPVYKIASRDITNIPLLECVGRTGKPVILSTGMAGLDETREAIEALGDGPSDIVLLQCVSQYPAEVEHVNLRAMQTLREEFGLLVGLSDHTSGIITSVAASVLGACLIEKHVTLARAMPGTDHAGALEEEGLRRLVQYVRLCARAMGDGTKEIDPVVEQAKAKLSRSLTSSCEIAAGTVLSEEMLTLKSPGTGLLWRERGRIIGKKATRDIPADVTLSEEDFA
jgi:sialic acid synthase SpsE/spore coat polysaccharide biosynthesis protein SpsF (cytidylyltransferase family)